VTLGWLRDHRCAALVGGAVLALGLQAHEVILGNPLGSSLVSLDASAFVVFVTAAGAVTALRSRVARALLVRTAWWARSLWLASLTAILALVLAAADPRTEGPGLVGQLALLLWLPLALCAIVGEAVALTTVFGLFVAHMVTPRLGPAPWWSPLLHRGDSGPDLVVAGLLLAATGWAYVANAGGRRSS
jgi:hypothetical protein